MITLGMNHGLGLYLVPITKHLNIGRELFGLSIALQVLFAGIGAPIFGGLADKYGPGKTTLFGTIILIISRYWMANINNTFDLFGSLFLLGFGGGGFLGIALGAVARSSKNHNRSLYVGIIMSAGSFGQFIIVPIINILIQKFGWVDSLYYMIYLSLVLILFCYFLSFSKNNQQTNIDTKQTVTEALKEALSNKNFNLLALGFFVCGFHIAFVATHLPAYVVDHGLNAGLGASALAVLGLGNLFGTIGSGYLGGRYRVKYVLSALYLLRSVLIGLFLSVPVTDLSVLVFAFALGLVWLGTVPLTNSLVGQIFGLGNVGMLFGIVFVSHQIGSFFGAWYGGYSFDVHGSYAPAWGISIALGVVAAVLHYPIDDRAVPQLAGVKAR